MLYAEETVRGVRDEITELAKIHGQEISEFKDIFPDIDFKVYEAMEEANCLQIFTARTDTNHHELIGYAVYIYRSHSHYRSSIQATNDALFIMPGYRGNGLKFLKYCEEGLKRRGVEVIYQTVTMRFNFSVMLERFGYGCTEMIYSKRLSN